MVMMKQISFDQELDLVLGEEAPQKNNILEFWQLKSIVRPCENDVLFGLTGYQPKLDQGNTNFSSLTRSVLSRFFDKRMKACPTHKDLVAPANQVVKAWRRQSPPGRFLKLDDETGLWYDVGDKQARKKTRSRMMALIKEKYDGTSSSMSSGSAENSQSSDNSEDYERSKACVQQGKPRGEIDRPSDPIEYRNFGGLETSSVSISIRLPNSFLRISLNESLDPVLPKALLSACVVGNNANHGSDDLFLDCSAITTVNLPANNLNMDACSLRGCPSLVSVGLPCPILQNITSLSCHGGSSLKITNLQQSDTTLYEYAFIGYSPEIQIAVVTTLSWTSSPNNKLNPFVQGQILVPSLKKSKFF